MNARWKKVWRDLWLNGSRTILVILSIAVGVTAIGIISSTRQALTSSLAQQYAAIHPAEIVIKTEPQLDDDFVTGVRHMRGVEEVEGRNSFALRLSPDGSGDTWRDITLYTLDDFDEQKFFFVRPQNGALPLEKGEVWLERASMIYLGAEVGDSLLVKTPDGSRFHLTVMGEAHDLYRIPPILEGWIYGYISEDTLRWMGQETGFNELYIDAEGDVLEIAGRVADRVEGLGLPVYQKNMPDQKEHSISFIIQTVLILLDLLAVLSFVLSALLVINVISALLAQQERQIGIMKAVGARSHQIVGLYLGYVLILSLAACILAVPFSNLGANVLAGFVSRLLNFDSPHVGFSIQSLLMQVGVGLMVPLMVSLAPILRGTHISPARVLSEYGISQTWRGVGLVDRTLKAFPRLGRDVLLALRNPFRKRARLILSLVTLTCAGAIFMSIVNLQASLNASLTRILGFWNYDAWLVTDNEIPSEKLVNKVLSVPGVKEAEAWNFCMARYVRPDGTESADLYLMAPPVGTDMLVTSILDGRALLPEDVNAIIVTPGFMQVEPAVRLGSDITIKIEGQEVTFRVVGVMEMIGNSALGYMSVINYEDFARVVREPNRANSIIFNTTTDNLDEQRMIVSQVEEEFDRSDIEVVNSFLVGDERMEIDNSFSIIIVLLLIMTLVLAVVGGLGLTGTMSLNVIERTREIGVMRAYGASSAAVFRVVILEGLLIGLLSWVLSIPLSLPISTLLARVVGLSFMSYAIHTTFSPAGVLGWALLVVVISIAASALPALRAVRLTVTRVLAYE